MLDPMLEQLLPGFLDEAEEICQGLTRELIELEKAPAQGARFDDFARGLHTLKGSAATLALDGLADFAHRMESAVLPLRGSAAPLPAALADALLRSIDLWMAHLRARVAKLELPDLAQGIALLLSVQSEAPGKARANAPGHLAAATPGSASTPLSASPPPEPADERPPTDETSWRVSTRQVIGLLHEVERLREVRLRIDERRRELARALAALEALGKTRLASETAETRAFLMGLGRSLKSDAEETADVITSMEEQLRAISSVPVRTVLDPLRRAVRDLCRSSGKLARLSVVGAEVSLDRRVLEQLRGPLVHLVRNAVDHGLELPEVREATGKDREGALTIRVEQQGNMLFVEVADDGAGIDLPRLTQVALERGVATADELASMGPAQLHQLIFRPGFSTRSEVSEVSGRGVGLDVVRNQVQALRGHVEVQSLPGQGTRFLLTLPAELGSSPVLAVRCGEHQLGLPMMAVESSRLARPADLRVGRTLVQLVHREQLVPVQDLGAVMGLRQPEPPWDGQPLLVLHWQGARIAFSVDEVLGDRDLVIRPLPREVRDLPAYQGAATLARGELMLILRPDWLVNLERRGAAGLAGTRRALVVDDSLTARASHRTTLEAGGFVVHTAGSGLQALEQLRHSTYDVMVCDIGMEEMDGFQLATTVRQRRESDTMPILLVSARESDADRQRGAAAGGDGFLTKQECVSGRLLSEVSAAIARRKARA